jgi:transposase
MSRPIFVPKLTKAEQAQITRLIRSNEDARIVRRAQMIRLPSQGKKTSEIAEMWGVTGATVSRTIQNFDAEGLKSLADKPRKGRPRKTTEHYVSLLKEVVQESPRDFGYLFSSWTLDRLREHLGHETGTLLNPHNVRACRKVLSAPWDVTITPLDTCGLVRLTGQKYAKARDS